VELFEPSQAGQLFILALLGFWLWLVSRGARVKGGASSSRHRRTARRVRRDALLADALKRKIIRDHTRELQDAEKRRRAQRV
jgi:hypothetical protein